MPAHQHKRTTPKTTIPIINYRPPSNRYSKEGVPHPPPRCPSCSTRARLRLVC